MRVLIVGGGGREHALAWKIAQSPGLAALYCAPGNAGIASVAGCVAIPVDNTAALLQWAREQRIDLTVVGPEAPLAAGLADAFRQSGLVVFGPGRAGSQLEGSKAWAKELMVAGGIPTAPFKVFEHYRTAYDYLQSRPEGPVVVKADGLAAGKGVTVARNRDEAAAALKRFMVENVFGAAGRRVVIENRLEGEEVTVLALTDGKNLALMPPSQDHKAAGEGDTGPNTGGMGAYSPVPVLTPELENRVEKQVFRPLLKELKRRGIDYRGVLYAGLMVSGGSLNVLEFNARFGDPETQVVLPRLKSDLLPLLAAAARGDLLSVPAPVWHDNAAVCVVLASAGYPGAYRTGFAISGLEELERENRPGLAVFHAGTSRAEGGPVTAGGRVLGVTAWESSLSEAADRAYGAVERINFNGCFYRRDIAHRALIKKDRGAEGDRARNN